jgi:hypothetical protein
LQHIPRAYSNVFEDLNQLHINLVDNDVYDVYHCDLYFSKRNIKEIYVGKGWYQYIRDQHLNVGDTLGFILRENHPEILKVAVVHRV